MESIQKVLSIFLQESKIRNEEVASGIGVSVASISRWAKGNGIPNASNEGKLRRFIQNHASESLPLFDGAAVRNLQSVRSPFYETLKALRETIHRSGNIASRNEALDELNRLLLTHVLSIVNLEKGVESIPRGNGSAARLNKFVSETYSKFLPDGLVNHFDGRQTELKLPQNADAYADEIITSFHPLSEGEVINSFTGHKGIDIVNEIFGQFLSQAFHDEKEFGQYLTPNSVVHFMASIALNSLQKEDLEILLNPSQCTQFGYILDPSCGTGSFLSETARIIYRTVSIQKGEKAAHRWLQTMLANSFVGIDKSDRMLQLCLTNLALLGAEKINLFAANSLRMSGQDGQISSQLDGKVRLILTNPPFGAEFSGNDLLGYRLATEWADRPPRSINSELLFIERYGKWLCNGGTLVAVVPDSILFNKGIYTDLRRGLSQIFELISCTSLPPNTFAAAGTNTKTSILHLRKKAHPSNPSRTFFAICTDVGFTVSSRGAQRKVVETDKNSLPSILNAFCADHSTRTTEWGWVDIHPDTSRWDSNFHLSAPPWLEKTLKSRTSRLTQLKDLVQLSTEKVDPRRSQNPTFQYVEISDVDPVTNSVSSKTVATRDAPSRARKVIRSDDVLVSTVRPERRSIAVVPPDLDGSICSTGFAVLRPTTNKQVSLAIARLLQSKFATLQILRHNVGISYPAIDEECLMTVSLPASQDEIDGLTDWCKKINQLQVQLEETRSAFDSEIRNLVDQMSQNSV
mgnify:CR=1 FL=1|tara:strand:+ start:73 stop:2310 length:2238 start_codon:yes stop_codon:yes gene_type:complete